jgi:hypothetical protein
MAAPNPSRGWASDGLVEIPTRSSETRIAREREITQRMTLVHPRALLE